MKEVILLMSKNAPPVGVQFENQGLLLNNVDTWQEIYNAIYKLCLTNILTADEKENALKKLLRGMYNESTTL